MNPYSPDTEKSAFRRRQMPVLDWLFHAHLYRSRTQAKQVAIDFVHLQ